MSQAAECELRAEMQLSISAGIQADCAVQLPTHCSDIVLLPLTDRLHTALESFICPQHVLIDRAAELLLDELKNSEAHPTLSQVSASVDQFACHALAVHRAFLEASCSGQELSAQSLVGLVDEELRSGSSWQLGGALVAAYQAGKLDLMPLVCPLAAQLSLLSRLEKSVVGSAASYVVSSPALLLLAVCWLCVAELSGWCAALEAQTGAWCSRTTRNHPR